MLKRSLLQSLKKQIDKNLENRDLSQRNSKLKNLCFLVHENYFNDIEFLYTLGTELGLQRENVNVLIFAASGKRGDSHLKNIIVKKDFNGKGELLNTSAEEFLNYPFDVLIGIYEDKHTFMDLMVSMSNANFKIGFYGADPRLFDLLLDINPKNKEALEATIQKYLKIFNKI
jgi:hypothetical protein